MLRGLGQITIGISLICTTLSVPAQEVHFEVSAPRMVSVGEPFRIEYVSNTKPEEFTPPTFGGFNVMAGPTFSENQSISIGQGGVKQAASFAYTFVLYANEAGNLTIPAAQAKIKGKLYSTKSLLIEVVSAEAISLSAGGTGRSTQEGGATQTTRPTGKLAPDDVVVQVSVNRNHVYKGQPVKAIFKLYTRVPILGTEKVSNPALNGFWAQDLNLNAYKWQREAFNGKVYDSRIIREVLLYPQQSGTLYVEQFGMTIVSEILPEDAHPKNEIDLFMGTVTPQQVRKTVSAPPVQITVEEFPSGAPASFNGAVGSFQIEGKLSAASMSANSSGTYFLKIAGTGNLPLIQAPKLNLAGSFELYNIKSSENLTPTTSGIQGSRQFEYPFIPRAEGDYTIPPVEFSYFDPEKRQYITLTTSPESFTITPDTGGFASAESGGLMSGVNKEDLKILAHDIRFIDTDNPKLSRQTTPWFGSWSYVLTLLLIAAGAYGGYTYLKKELSDRQNSILMRNKKANKVALQRLNAAKNHMESDDERHFYEEMLRALWGYMSDKLNIPVANLTKDNIREELERRGIAQEQIDRFIRIISDCEYAQYAPSSSAQMKDVYQWAANVLAKLESDIK